jgi:hypothetical protein
MGPRISKELHGGERTSAAIGSRYKISLIKCEDFKDLINNMVTISRCPVYLFGPGQPFMKALLLRCFFTILPFQFLRISGAMLLLLKQGGRTIIIFSMTGSLCSRVAAS